MSRMCDTLPLMSLCVLKDRGVQHVVTHLPPVLATLPQLRASTHCCCLRQSLTATWEKRCQF
jgi:hypothetical protein